MSSTSTTGRAALVAANGRARRPAEPPQGELSHAEAQRGGERRDCCQCENVANTQSQYPIGIGNIGTGNTSTMATFSSLPNGWEVRYGKSIFTENKRKNKSLENSTILSLSYGKIVVKKSPDEGLVPAEYSGYQILSPGDIVIRCTDLQNDQRSQRVGIVEVEGIITSAYLGLKVNDGVSSRYIAYWLKNWDATKEIYRYGSGLRQSLSWVDLKYLPIPLPLLPEQKAIVAYLDAETGRIDKAIAAEEKMIALLQERREIVINEAVGGRDLSHAEVQRGRVRRGWEIRRLKSLLRPHKILVGKHCNEYDLLSLTLRGIVKRDMDNPEGKFPASFETYQEVNPGEFVFCMFDNEETPRAVGLSSLRGMITGAYDVMSLIDSGISSKYLNYYFLWIDDGKRLKPLYKGLRKTVPLDSFMTYKIPLPPLPEQKAIVERLDRETGKIDRAIEVKRRQIELLRERRQIVIDEVVTGKVKVA